MISQHIEISFWSMFKAILLVLLFWMLWILRDIIAVLLLSIVIASAIEPANHWFAKHRIQRVASVILIYLSTFLLLVMTFYLVLPPIFNDIFSFMTQLPDYV